MLIRLLVCAGMGVGRLAELAYSRRNMAERGEAAEGAASRRIFPLIVALHTLVIVAVLLRGRNRPSLGWLLLLIAAQAPRLWVLQTLGNRWNARGAVPAEMEIETGGPYAYVRHPNYSVVAVELASLPLAFGMRRAAVLASLANAALLAIRIRDEETALMTLPGYEEHFADKPRFVPRIN